MGKTNLSNAEAKLMEIVWEAHKPLTFSQLLQSVITQTGKDIQKQTLRTQIIRVIDKGVLKEDKSGKYILYSPAITKEHYNRTCASDLLTNLYDGSIRKFILALSGGESLDEETVSELRKLLEE